MSSTSSARGLSSTKSVYAKLDSEDIAKITGNASNEIKEHVATVLYLFMGRGTGFADTVGEKIRVTEVSIVEKAEEPAKMEGRVVCEIVVAKGVYWT